MLIFVIIALVIAVLAVILALQNPAIVTVNFLFWQLQNSLALVLLLALIAGALVSLLALLPALVRGQFSLRSLRKKASELEIDLSDHRQKLADALARLEAAVKPPASEPPAPTPPPGTPPGPTG